MTRLFLFAVLGSIVLANAIARGQDSPVAKPPQSSSPPFPIASSPPSAIEVEETRRVVNQLETALARPAKELAQEALRIGADVIGELDHGVDLARLDQRESHLTRRLDQQRKLLAEKQAESKHLKQELSSRSTEISEQYDDEEVRDRLLNLLLDEIRPQLLDLKADMEVLEADAKTVMTRLAELRVLTAERRFARDQSARSTQSTERLRNVTVDQLEKKWSQLPKSLAPRERVTSGRSATAKPNAPASPGRSTPAKSPMEQLKELNDL